MTLKNQQTDHEPKIAKTLMDDLFHTDFRDTLHRDFKDLKEFMLSEGRRARLKKMNRVKRGLTMAWWLFKSLILKLTPTRRILLLIGGILILQYNTHSENQNFHFLGAMILLFVLMLELKDKLLAHEELEAGHAIQKALTPERSPKVQGWDLWLFTRSANEVGGDLIDFVRRENNRFGIALGDVAGKGLHAALLTAKLQAALEAIVNDFTSLSKMGEKLNHIFYRNRLPNIFASMVYLEIRPDSESVRVLNIGHYEPLVLKGTEVEKMKKGGPALGIVPNASFTEQKITIRKGDLMLAYSDGLTEACNEQGDFFGEHRLLNRLQGCAGASASQTGERLVKEVDRFLGKAKANDDLSIVVIKKV